MNKMKHYRRFLFLLTMLSAVTFTRAQSIEVKYSVYSKQRFGYFDCGVQASYTKGRWSFFVDGKNLLHTRRFNRISVDANNDYTETIVESHLPGYIVVGLKKMF